MKNSALDQQPVARVVGRREPQRVGRPPSPEARAAWNAMAGYRTRAPKGVFIYRHHDEMAHDRERWQAEAMAAKAGR